MFRSPTILTFKIGTIFTNSGCALFLDFLQLVVTDRIQSKPFSIFSELPNNPARLHNLVSDITLGKIFPMLQRVVTAKREKRPRPNSSNHLKYRRNIYLLVYSLPVTSVNENEEWTGSIGLSNC